MGKLLFSLVLMLVLGVVWCAESQPALSDDDDDDDDTVRALLELIRLMGRADRKLAVPTGLDGPPDQLWSDAEPVEKRDLPRLGVSVYRPLTSRVLSSKSVDATRNRFSYPTVRLARLHG